MICFPLGTKTSLSLISTTISLFSIPPLLPTMPQATIQDPKLDGMRGLHVAQVLLFLSFNSCHTPYPCALVQWFVTVGDAPCSDTGMWIVKPELEDDGTQVTSIIHVDSIIQGAHLIGVYGDKFFPCDFSHFDSLSAFQAYYVNKFIDYHAYEIAF